MKHYYVALIISHGSIPRWTQLTPIASRTNPAVLARCGVLAVEFEFAGSWTLFRRQCTIFNDSVFLSPLFQQNDDLQLRVLAHDAVGKGFIKSCKVMNEKEMFYKI